MFGFDLVKESIAGKVGEVGSNTGVFIGVWDGFGGFSEADGSLGEWGW